MQLIPAIDLRHGEVVRLRQGDDGQRTTYGLDPRRVLEGFAAEGIERVHVVDLDAAFGETPQRSLIAELTGVGPSIEMGGGLRDGDAVAWALDDAGCERVVLGSMVVRDFDGFARLARRHAGRLVPALETAAGRLRIAGWTETSDLDVGVAARRLRGLPCPAVLVTDVDRDGMLNGPNVALCRQVAADSGLPVLMSGGVHRLDDLTSAAVHPELVGAIVGKALYDGVFTVSQAVAALAAVVPGGDHASGPAVAS